MSEAERREETHNAQEIDTYLDGEAMYNPYGW